MPSVGWTVDLRGRLDELLDEYQAALRGSLDEQARRRLVRSKTTLLGLVKHVTYVEGVWFDQAVTGRSYREIGIVSTPDQSCGRCTCRSCVNSPSTPVTPTSSPATLLDR